MKVRKDLPIHYRYDDYASVEGLEVRVSEFYPIGETECFYVVVDGFGKHCLDIGHIGNIKERRVSKNALRSYCYSSIDDALYSYKKRKEAQVRHNKFALAKANAALNKLSEIKKGETSFDCGRPAYWDSIVFD